MEVLVDIFLCHDSRVRCTLDLTNPFFHDATLRPRREHFVKLKRADLVLPWFVCTQLVGAVLSVLAW